MSRDDFRVSKRIEGQFYRALKMIAQGSAKIVKDNTDGASIKNPKQMDRLLKSYSTRIEPWARVQVGKMLEQTLKKNKRAYTKRSSDMAKQLKTHILNSELGAVAASLMEEQVHLIKSIPLKAGQRAQEIAQMNFIEGRRATPDPTIIKDLQARMNMTEQQAINRAKLIARTETSRASTAFVQARATNLGATEYIWRTTMDGAERKSHRKMNGKRCRFDSPPHLMDGTSGHPGQFFNCRCYADPQLPDE